MSRAPGRLAAISLFLALAGAPAPAQEGGPGRELAARPAREDLSALLEPIRSEHGLPALGALILRGREVVALGVAGVRKQGDPTPVTTGDLWHIGSCTKSMTATLLARLVEQGKVAWDTSVAEVFEEVAPELDSFWADVTLEHLLRHRGGVTRDFPAALWSKARLAQGSTRELRLELVRALIAEPPEQEPGRFLYSNAGYTIAGTMAEVLTDKAWEDLIREQVFSPLGMTSAGFGAPGTAEAVLQPMGHASSAGTFTAVVPGPEADNPPVIGPAGTVHCSLEDWARYAAFHVQGERGELAPGSLLSNETVRLLHRTPDGADYALGWGVGTSPAAGRVLQHRGSNTLWLADIRLSPEKDFGLLLVTNATGPGAERAFTAAVDLLMKRALEPR